MMCIRDESKALAMTPLFKEVCFSELRRLAFASDRVTFSDGEEIIRQGDEAEVGYVIMCGEAEMSVKTKNGEGKLGTVGAGHLVGEAAMLAGTPYLITVRAKGEVEALRIQKEYVHKMLESCANMTSMALQSLSERIAKLEAKYEPIGAAAT